MRKVLRMCVKYCTFAVAFENNQKQNYKQLKFPLL